jgi:hypothetical protein
MTKKISRKRSLQGNINTMHRSSTAELSLGTQSTQSLSRSTSCFELHHNSSVESDLGLDLEPSSLYFKNDCSSAGSRSEPELLYLPRKGSIGASSIDEYLSSIPRVVSRASELQLAKEQPEFLHKTMLASGGARVLNVLQGEVAHASTLQADYLVSAEATTCHVVVLRSTKSASIPLVSLAHVDKAYDSCLEAMVKEHLHHHEQAAVIEAGDDEFGFFMEEDEEEVEHLVPLNDSEQQVPLNDVFIESQQQQASTSSNSFLPNPNFEPERTTSMPDLTAEPIEMELHMMGGFLDKDGTSQQLSTLLVERFNYLAEKYKDRLRISLSTAAISCMNNTRDSKPVNRGLGIEIATGEIFPVKSALPAHLEGPAVDIRSARAFSEDAAHTLAIIHDRSSKHGQVRVQPFQYKAAEELNVLLTVPDDVLLSVTSTSPDEESDQFCTNFRRTLSFVNTVPPETAFANGKPLVYSRSASNMNEWIEAH